MGLTAAHDEDVTATMQIPTLVAVERNADWSQWALVSRSLLDVVMLVQQPEESSLDFQRRLLARARADKGRFLQVILLRCAACSELEPLSAAFVARLLEHAAVGLHVYPRDAIA